MVKVFTREQLNTNVDVHKNIINAYISGYFCSRTKVFTKLATLNTRWRVSQILWMYLMHPSSKEPKAFGKAMQNLEGDWTNYLSITFNQTIRFVTAGLQRHVTTSWLAAVNHSGLQNLAKASRVESGNMLPFMPFLSPFNAKILPSSDKIAAAALFFHFKCPMDLFLRYIGI